MMLPSLRMAVLIVLVLVAVAAVARAATRRYDGYLAGYWTGDPAFLERADLADMQLFISPAAGGEREGYLIMTDADGGYVANAPLTLRTRFGLASGLRAALRASGDVCRGRARFEAEGEAPPFPSPLRVSLSVLDGTLTLYDGEKVWAFLRKDHAASAVALAAWEEG